MIKVKETIAILILAFISSGCVSDLIPAKEDFVSWNSIKKDLTLWKNPGPLTVNGKVLNPQETHDFHMIQGYKNGHITSSQYNQWARTRYSLTRRPYGDPHFYLDHTGTVKRVPKRNTIDWMWYERTVLGTRSP